MTERHSGYVVVLADDIREDDAEAIITALRQIRGVIGVAPVESSPEQQIAQMRADARWRELLLALVRGNGS